MGFYGTLKLIFFKVSSDYRIDQLIRDAGVGLVRDDEAFFRHWGACVRARAGQPLQNCCDEMIDRRSAAGACCQSAGQIRFKCKPTLRSKGTFEFGPGKAAKVQKAIRR